MARMFEEEKKTNTAYFIVGISVGVSLLSAMLYFLLRRRCKEILIPIKTEHGQTYTFIPPRAIPLTQETGLPERSDLSRLFSLELRARPSVFKRGETGSIVVTTLPGVICGLEARYSTGASPVSLHKGSINIGPAGQHRWVWDIGTSGSYVDVIVHAEKAEYGTQKSTLRVEITD